MCWGTGGRQMGHKNLAHFSSFLHSHIFPKTPETAYLSFGSDVRTKSKWCAKSNLLMLTIIGLRHILKTQLCLGFKNKCIYPSLYPNCYQKTESQVLSIPGIKGICKSTRNHHCMYPMVQGKSIPTVELNDKKSVSELYGAVTGWTLWIKRAGYYPSCGTYNIWKYSFSPCCLHSTFRKKIIKNEVKKLQSKHEMISTTDTMS